MDGRQTAGGLGSSTGGEQRAPLLHRSPARLVRDPAEAGSCSARGRGRRRLPCVRFGTHQCCRSFIPTPPYRPETGLRASPPMHGGLHEHEPASCDGNAASDPSRHRCSCGRRESRIGGPLTVGTARGDSPVVRPLAFASRAAVATWRTRGEPATGAARIRAARCVPQARLRRGSVPSTERSASSPLRHA